MQQLARRNARALGPVVSLALQQSLLSGDGLLERLPIGVYTCDRDGYLVQYNRRAAQLWGYAPPCGDKRFRFCGARNTYRLNGEAVLPSQSPMSEVLRTRRPIHDHEIIVERPDGSRVTVLANLDPLFDAAGQLIGGVGCFHDISRRKEAEAMLRERERRHRELLEALPAAIYTTDASGRVTFCNRAATDLAGRRPELGRDEWCVAWRLLRPDGTPLPHDECPTAVALKENRAVTGAEAIAVKPDGTPIPFIAYPTPLRDTSGVLVGAVSMLVDISERKQAEARQKTLIDELNHRVKNTLATVQALAARTLHGVGVSDHVREGFEARLFALSRAHDQLTRERWAFADLRAILDDVIAPYRDRSGVRVELAGDAVRLSPKAALTLVMVLHELAANAARHGALSRPDGAVVVSWAVGAEGGGRMLRIAWRESGGPEVHPPVRCGFGSRLIERAVVDELKGSAEIAFAPAGLCCTIEVPLLAQPA
jgi:PAS domain S-box-containing protein